jgi:hypothetical protein
MHSLRRTTRERTLAQNAVRSISERIHAASEGFADEPERWAADLLATYGAGGSAGEHFDVLGLAEVAEGQRVGTITFGTDETVSDQDFGRELGLPRDLNGDGDATDTDVSASARILPVTLTLRWTGENGVQVLRHGFYVMGY